MTPSPVPVQGESRPDWVVRGIHNGETDRPMWLHCAGPGAGFSYVIATPMTRSEAAGQAGMRELTEAGSYDMTFSVEPASEAPKLDERTYAECAAVWAQQRAEREVIAAARERMDDAIADYVQVLRAAEVSR